MVDTNVVQLADDVVPNEKFRYPSLIQGHHTLKLGFH
jgi:hypothetical protein